MPYGPEELVLVEHVAEDALQLFLVQSDSSRRPLYRRTPGRSGATCEISSGWRFRNSSIISISFGYRCHGVGLEDGEAQSGSRPTIDRTFRRVALPSGRRRTS